MKFLVTTLLTVICFALLLDLDLDGDFPPLATFMASCFGVRW